MTFLAAWCLQAFDTLTQLFEGALPQFHPDPYPGLPTFVGSEHPEPDNVLLSTEFQVSKGVKATQRNRITSAKQSLSPPALNLSA